MTKFKVGDRVELLNTTKEMYDANFYKGSLDKGHIGTVTEVTLVDVKVDKEGKRCWIHKSQVKLSPEYVNPPHKHADVIKAWADGAEIEAWIEDVGAWAKVDGPSWKDSYLFRIKSQKSSRQLKIEELEAQARKLAEDIKELRNV